jgi:hypothetical protein
MEYEQGDADAVARAVLDIGVGHHGIDDPIANEVPPEVVGDPEANKLYIRGYEASLR